MDSNSEHLGLEGLVNTGVGNLEDNASFFILIEKKMHLEQNLEVRVCWEAGSCGFF